MSSYKWKKLLRHIWLIALMLAICIVTTACAFQKELDATAYSEPTEAIEEEEVTLYFNVDREEYDGKGEDGFTGREKDPDTGYFQIMFAGKGRVSLRRVADRRVVNKIDNQDVMALVQDDNGIVTDIITVDDCTGGYYMKGKKMYVSAVDGNVLTLYGNSDLLGSSYTLEYTADTKIYDVSEMAEEDGTQGSVTTLTENDKILVIYDKDGAVGWIFVTERVRPMETRTMYCDHCQEEVTWYGWNLEDSLPTSGEGHYWLTEDVACSGQMSMAEDANIVLDLNGHTVTGIAGKRIYSLHNPNTYLAIMDYSEAGSGKMVGGKTEAMTNQGGIVWVRYGTFELYGGTLDASQVSGSAWGMAVHVPKDCVFRMFGGTIIGGTSVGSYEPAKDSLTGGVGGAVYVDGTFDMRGGQITGGTARACLKNGNPTRGNGGAVYISGTGSVSMTGGSITGGIADGIGGNVYVSGKATFTMSGSTWIANGQSKTGGNVYVSKNGIFTMNGGAVTNGRVTGSGGNVYAAESSVVRMAGGVIRDGTAVSGGGNVYVSGKSVFTLSGSAEIKNGEITGKGKNGGSVYVAKNGTFNMNGGVISGGTSRNCAGNMAVYGTLNMTDGVITGGKTLDYTTGKESGVSSKNLFVVNSTMNMSGGRIDGYVGLTSTEGKAFDATISGTAKIKGTAEGQPGLIIPTGKTIKVGKMEDGAEVYVTASGIFSEKTDAENAKYFHSDDTDMSVSHYEGCLAAGRIQCACGASVNGGNHMGDCTGEQHLFTAWTKTTELPTTPGYYYLTKDIVLKGQTSVKTSGELVLDLNGYTVTGAEGKRVYALWTDCAVTLSIMDTSTAQTGKLVAIGTVTGDVQGRVLWLRADHTVNLYGGTLDASGASGSYGLAICSETKSTINMYGGKIIGGTAASDKSGGAVRIGAATFNMYGGTITGGTAKNGGNVYVVSGGKFVMKGGTISGGTATGIAGNIYIGGNSSLTMSGEATVANGTSGAEGGNVYVSSKATVEMSGGEIKDGSAVSGGGNVYVLENGVFTLSGSAEIKNGEITGKGKNGGSVYVAKNGTFNMNGGVISGGTSRNCAGNMAVYGTLNMTDGVITGGKTLDYTTGKESGVSSKNLFVVNGTMNMSGGRIDGYVGLTSTEGKAFDVTISGTAKMKGTAEGQPGLIIPTGKTIKVGKMEDGAEVYVTVSGTFSEKTDAENAKYFHSDDTNKTVTHYDGCLANGHIQCDCGASVFGGEHLGQCDGKEHLFTAWTSATSLPTTPGRYYLTKDVALTGQMNVQTSGTLVLDLNGHTVTGADGKRVYALWTDCNVTLSITDTSEKQTGKLVAIGTVTGDVQGRVLWLRADHTVNLYGGTLDASGASGSYGLAICSETKSTINMYGGKIIGGTAASDKSGGAVRIGAATFNMYGGTITGGTAKDGGNVYVVSGGKFMMQGGTISNGTATGRAGNIYIGGNSSLTMSGEATVANGTSGTDGGNVYVSSKATVDVSGGEIKDGSAVSGGGNVYVLENGVFTLSGSAEIKNGEITGKGKNGGSVYVAKNGTFNMNGGVISGGTSRNCAGNMAVYGTLNMTDGVITGGKTLDYTTGKESGVSSKNLFVVNGTMNMSGGRIDGYVGLTSTEGKAFDVTISGTAKIKGTAEDQPGLIIPTGKTIKVGKMEDGAEVYVTASGTFTAATDEANAQYFHCDNSDITITYNGCLEAVGRYQCVCGASLNDGTHGDGCDQTEHLFTAWKETSKLPTTTGYYYLTKDVTLSAQATVEAADIVLDLNGHQVSSTGRIYELSTSENATLSITDSSVGKTGKISSTGEGYGLIVYLSGANKTLNLHAGTFDANNATGKDKAGVAIRADQTATIINMYGGKIIGGDAGGKSAGAVYIMNTTFNMKGGTIQGGKATNGGNVYVNTDASLNVTGGTITGGNATEGGGNVFVDKGTMTVGDGAVISNGNAKNGGNIYLKNQLTMTGGTITGGAATNKGNNVYMESAGKLTMSGGSIDAGVYLTASSTAQSICEVSGDATIINADKTSGITLKKSTSGKAPFVVIQNGFAGKIYVDVVEKTDGYKIATAGADSYAENIVVPEGWFAFYDTDCYKLYDSTKYRAQCICGASLNVGNHVGNHVGNCDGRKLLFTPWSEANELPTISGNYYLTGNVTLTGQQTIAAGASVVLDLNGYSVTQKTEGKRIYVLQGNLSITDSSAEQIGKMVVTGTSTNQGRIIWLGNNATLNLYGGTLDAGGASGCRGLGICAENKSTINMYGGKIVGGQADTSDGVTVRIANATFNMHGGSITGGTGNNGGNVRVGEGATFNMKGGTISGGTATKGDNVYVDGSGKLVMSGGSIDAGVYLYASDKGTPTCEISGEAKIINETRTSGIMLGRLDVDAPLVAIQDGFAGTIYLDAKETEFDGYKIATASADSYTGNIVVRNGYFLFYESDGSYALYDSTKYRAQCVCGASVNGEKHVDNCDGTKLLFTPWSEANKLPTISGNYYLTDDVELSGQVKIVSDGTIVLDLNGHEVTRKSGGRIYALWSKCKVMLSITDSSAGQTGKITSTGADKGLIVWLADTHTLNLYGGTLDASGASGSNGLAICADNSEGKSTINMYGGTIIGGDAGAKSAGTVYMKNAIFNMYGGTIQDGKATNGGNIYVSANATLNVTGGTITGGTATEGGGNVFVESSATMTMGEGAVISGGTAKNGGNIYLKNQLTMNGGTITGGKATSNGKNVYMEKTGKLTIGGTIEDVEGSIYCPDGATIIYPNTATAMEIDVCAGGEAVDETATTENAPTESTPTETKPAESESGESVSPESEAVENVTIITEPTAVPEETEEPEK